MKAESFAFWMICFYIFFEYFRPQGIFPIIDFLPWAQIFIMLSALGWILDGQKQWVSNPANKWMLLFFIVILASSYLGFRPDISFNHLANFYTWLIIYFLIINIVTTEKRFIIFLLIIFAASFKMSLFGARTWAMRGFSFTKWGISGPVGYFQNSGELAIQMLVFAGLSYYFYLFCSPYLTKWRRRILLLFPVTAAMTVIAASSRGSQIGLVVQIYQVFIKGKVSFKSIALVATIVTAGYWLMPDEQMERFSSMGEDKTSQQRLLYWENGWEMIKEHPALGVGYFNFIPYYEQYYPDDILHWHAELPHNIFIQVGTDVGFTGLIIYLVLVLQVFLNARKIRKMELTAGREGSLLYQLSKGIEVGFIGFLIAGQFVTVGYYPFMWIHLALVVAMCNVAGQLPKP